MLAKKGRYTGGGLDCLFHQGCHLQFLHARNIIGRVRWLMVPLSSESFPELAEGSPQFLCKKEAAF